MKIKYAFLIFAMLFSFQLFSQEQKNLNFIIHIDGTIPTINIFDGFFIIKNLENNISDTISFVYQVGMLKFKESDYNHLFSENRSSEIKIKFTFRRFISGWIEDQQYEHIFPYEFLNEVYTILNVYNSYHSNSRKKYYFGNKKYLIQLHAPSLIQILPFRKSYKILPEDR